MILKVFCVLQVFLIQVIIISAQLFRQDLSSQNVLNNLANLPLARYGRSRRQVNNPSVGLSGNGNLPVNGLANGLQFRNSMPFGNFPRGNGLPNNLAFNNGLPNGLAFNNGLPNNFAINNGMALPNNLPFNAPFLNINNMPQNKLLPSINGINNNGLPFNNVLNGLPNTNNLPIANKFPYFNNVPPGTNILNLNNLPTANSLPNINTMPINGLPSLNNPPCGNAMPQINGLPLNNMPSGNILSPINNRLPNINNFRITGIGIGNGIADINRFPRNNLQDGTGLLSNANNLHNANGLPEVSDGLANINNNGFSSVTNTPPASLLPNNMPANDRFSNVNHFMYHNGVPNIANEAQNMNNMQLPDVSNFQNFNVMPINQQRCVNNIPPSNSFVVPNNFPANTAVPTTNRLANAINTGMPISNGGYFNDMFANNNGMAVNTPETFLQINDGHEFPSNDFQFGNMQVPVNNWHYDFVGANLPSSQNLSEGVQMFSNVLNDYQSALTSNNFNLAQDLVKNLQIDGLGNLPFFNGLPVAGITETVTFLNGPYNK